MRFPSEFYGFHKRSKVECLIDGHNGVYSGQALAEMIQGDNSWTNFDSDDIATLLEGPDHEWYFEAYDSILRSAKWGDYHLWTGESGDIFIVHDSVEYDDYGPISEGE